MQRLPSSASRLLVAATAAAAAAGAGALFWARYGPGGSPMRLFRDSEGVLRFQTRRDVLEQRAARAWAALQAAPDGAAEKLAFGLAQHALEVELARLRAAAAGGEAGAGGAGEAPGAPRLRDEDLK
jgi:hypothetical protein